MTRFRAATYNVHKSRGMDLRTRPERVLAVVREIRADLVALQEVMADHLDALTPAGPWNRVFVEVRKHAGTGYGNLVLSRFPVLSHRDFDLSVTGREPRRGLRVDVDLGCREPLHTFAVHLGTSYFERRRQAEKLFSADVLCNPDLSGPRLVLGDFNEWTRGMVTRRLSHHLRRAEHATHPPHKRTYPGLLPFLSLDNIYADAPLKVRLVHLHNSRIALVASDHLPLVADFEW